MGRITPRRRNHIATDICRIRQDDRSGPGIDLEPAMHVFCPGRDQAEGRGSDTDPAVSSPHGRRHQEAILSGMAADNRIHISNPSDRDAAAISIDGQPTRRVARID